MCCGDGSAVHNRAGGESGHGDGGDRLHGRGGLHRAAGQVQAAAAAHTLPHGQHRNMTTRVTNRASNEPLEWYNDGEGPSRDLLLDDSVYYYIFTFKNLLRHCAKHALK